MMVVNIVCLGHSGSTLLGNILGSHSQGLHVGEVVSPLKKNRPVICRNCLDKPCPVWGTVITEDFLREVYGNFNKFRNLGSASLWKRLLFKTRSGELYTRLFHAFPEKKFIIDSSKNVHWYQYNARSRNLAVKYIFLKRNVNAVLAAYKRGYQRDVSEYFSDISRNIGSLNRLYSNVPEKDRIVLAYEDFVSSPVENLEKLSAFLGISYEGAMMDYNSKIHHLIGGNQGVYIQADPAKAKKIDSLVGVSTPEKSVSYYTNLSGLQLDERWKDELSEEDLRQISAGIERKIEF